MKQVQSTLFIPVDLREKLEGIEKRLDQLLQSEQSQQKALGPSGFLNETEATKFLGKSKTWLYYQRKEGRITSFKLGSKNFFKITDLENLLSHGEK